MLSQSSIVLRPEASTALLSVEQHSQADEAAIAGGQSRDQLIDAAGAAAAQVIGQHYAPRPTLVFAGPGHNGGDGWQIARELKRAGWPVEVCHMEPATPETRRRMVGWTGQSWPLATWKEHLGRAELVIDALFGAGLSRPLSGDVAAVCRALQGFAGVRVAVDLPSGVSGNTGRADPATSEVDLTVTFLARKPGHLVGEGRRKCAEVVCTDIGHGPVVDWSATDTLVNDPKVWGHALPRPDKYGHKYDRGLVSVISGGAGSTGAARLAARAALSAGAGLARILTPPGALLVAAAQETAVMTRAVADDDTLIGALAKSRTVVIGPGLGTGDRERARVLHLLSHASMPLVIDADALSMFADAPDQLLSALRAHDVLTPHGGEFARLFPDLADTPKLQATREAARRASCVIVHKGADTIVADASGFTLISERDAPMLATAGSGDTLAGIIAALLAQGAPSLIAATAGVWVHARTGARLPVGSTAEDLAPALPETLQGVYGYLDRLALQDRFIHARSER